MNEYSSYLFIILGFVVVILLFFIFIKTKYIKLSQFIELEEKVNQHKEDLITLKYIKDENTKLNEKVNELDNMKNELSNSLTQVKSQNEDLKIRNQEYLEKINIEENEKIKHTNILNDLKSEHAKLTAENNTLFEKLDTQKEEIEKMYKNNLAEFQSLANKILDEKSDKFTKSNQENIKQILEPFDTNLKALQKKVEETYDKESKERFSLDKTVKELFRLTNQVSQEAKNLTNALKADVKKQGNWGEMILDTILDNSGLTKGQQYFLQDAYKDSEGNTKLPDVVVKFPDNREVIIDSKVSLVAYEKYVNAETSDVQKIALNEHLTSLKNHIDNLHSKNYFEKKDSLDFILLFVPIEPAYLLAIQQDSDLWNYAYQKKILLISPTNLITTLKLISELWKRDTQNKNALDIADRGKKLYDKFVSFVEDFKDIDKHINKTQDSYNNAFNKLTKGRGNLISQAEKLIDLGVSPKKEIPEEFINNNDLLEEENE